MFWPINLLERPDGRGHAACGSVQTTSPRYAVPEPLLSFFDSLGRGLFTTRHVVGARDEGDSLLTRLAAAVEAEAPGSRTVVTSTTSS